MARYTEDDSVSQAREWKVGYYCDRTNECEEYTHNSARMKLKDKGPTLPEQSQQRKHDDVRAEERRTAKKKKRSDVCARVKKKITRCKREIQGGC